MQISERSSAERESLEPMKEREFKNLRELVQEHTGIWLQDGKRTMLAARLAKPMRRLGLASFQAYYILLSKSAKGSPEFVEFVNAITTNKTSFFREMHHFHYLAEKIVPEIKAAALRGGRKQIRVWSAACSTGEEVYSIAMTLLDAVPELGWRLEVVGSDIDTGVLESAEGAIYLADCLENIDESLHARYFLRGKDSRAGQVKLKPQVTRMVDLRRVNLMEEGWFVDGPFDVIFFRNALIYFQQDVQERFLRRMIGMLRPGGYLFIGNSEQIPWLHDTLEPLSQTMYRLRG
ncbi:chemotaxis protein methyltransferase CheR [Granulicella aggregans]|uniref:protein-glutamate O-methyltransferase n=1 Tax=Granulicella aggregans TaxID=474949 RepID=A0A7W7ZB94_9BACT|nr:CheR family methyltransferase [Granulicella aggregans]MBB5056414.1 chemotaxis protein methyltransferase CheR [Granulicella aggregans]